MAEAPSLSEITNINVNPIIGGGESTPVIDNRGMVENLNQAARYHAENTWRKYTTFLKEKEELFKNISAIQDIPTAQQDRELLKGQAAEILGDIAKDPSIVMGGNGYAEIQGKIAKFKADAMTSKQDKVDDELNARFMAANPELMSDDNTAMRQNFWKAPLGARKPVMLKMPTIFDEKTAVEGLIKAGSREFSEIVGKDGKPGEGYIMEGVEVDPEVVRGGWNMIVKGGQQDKNSQDLVKAVQDRYNKLPERERAKYEENGGIEKFWADKGDQYLKAYFPDGKYRVVKDIKADPNYLGDKRIAQDEKELKERTENDRANRAIEWAKINIRKDELNKVDKEDETGALSVINEAASIINNGTKLETVDANGKNPKTILRISDPTLLQKFGNVDKDGKVTNAPDAINFDPTTNQPTLLYYRDEDKKDQIAGGVKVPRKTDGRHGLRYDREIPLDQRTWLKVITQRSFPNKDIGEINNLVEKALLQNNNSIYEISQRLKNQGQAAPAQTPAAAPKVMTPAEFDAYLKKKGLK